MRLYEFEAKKLLEEGGIAIPRQLQLGTLDKLSFLQPCVVKAQVLFGNRAGQGLIHVCQTEADFNTACAQLPARLQELNQNPNSTLILVEELVPYTEEMYLAFRYDTRWRKPVLLTSLAGGTGIEERGELQTIVIDPSHLPEVPGVPALWLEQLWKLFWESDATLIEINPLIKTSGGFMALDGKIELDDTAIFRHEDWAATYPPRTLFQRQPTEREQAAKAVNALDHRGVAGASYLEFTGTIGILASGGGASLLAMDALLSTDLKPANYTEYSGNPPREKVAALSRVVLSQPNLEGLWVIGGHANFTDIYETLMGVMDAVEEAKLPSGFPIVMRRGGPRMEEALAAVQKRSKALDVKAVLYDSDFPITDTVTVLQQLVQEFRQRQEGHVNSR